MLTKIVLVSASYSAIILTNMTTRTTQAEEPIMVRHDRQRIIATDMLDDKAKHLINQPQTQKPRSHLTKLAKNSYLLLT